MMNIDQLFPSTSPPPRQQRSSPRQGASPDFTYLDDQKSTPTWPQSQLWDRTYDEARFNDLAKKHSDDPTWLYSELHATRRRMHQAWTDNHQLSLRLGNAANMQTALAESEHKIIDLKRSQNNAVRDSSESLAQLARLRSRCEGLLITNERLEEFQTQAKATEQKWVGGLAECESYMKQLCERLEEATRAKEHYKQWSVDRTAQLREAELTLTKMLSELQAAVQQRDAYKGEAEERKHHVKEMADNLAATLDRAKTDSDVFHQQMEKLQETVVTTKMELSTLTTEKLQLKGTIENKNSQIQTRDGALNEARDQLKTSTDSCTDIRTQLQSTQAELKTTTQLATQLDGKLTQATIHLTVAEETKKNQDKHILQMETVSKDNVLQLEQAQWQIQVAKLELERSNAVHQEQYDLYEREVTENRAKIQHLQKAIDIARVGAEATTVARVAASKEVEMVVSNALQQQQQKQQQQRIHVQQQQIHAQQQQKSSPQHNQYTYDLDPFGGSREALREAGYCGRRSVLSNGLLASLEKNVVDYALLSLQRAGPILEKEKYRVRGTVDGIL